MEKAMNTMKNVKNIMNVLKFFVNSDWLEHQIYFPQTAPIVEVDFCIPHILATLILLVTSNTLEGMKP